MLKEIKKRGRPKKTDREIIKEIEVSKKQIDETLNSINEDELAPNENESEEHKRVRLIYVDFKLKNPEGWERDKVNLLEKLRIL